MTGTTAATGKLGEYLSEVFGEPIAVAELKRMEGGWSRQTLRAVFERPGGTRRAVALRTEAKSGVLDTSLEREWLIMKAVEGLSVPLPALFGFEPTGDIIGSPFMVMDWLDAVAPNPWRRTGQAIIAAAAAAGMGLRWVEQIAALHSPEMYLRVRQAGIDIPTTGDDYIRSELERWSTIIERAENPPGPLVSEACFWLDSHLPPHGVPPTVVHGDLRIGNMMLRGGDVVAFLDWEMAGVGDWRADLGYLLMPYNSGKLLVPLEPSASAVMPPEQFLELYEARTGNRLLPDDALYFMVLACVKMIAILTKGIDQFAAGRNDDPRLAWLAIPIIGLTDDIEHLLNSGRPW
jgi:aminoglycoside phosphotransferase (APT) family kinase protein